ncbi:FKBP-type peptidyl-prolyl cis-trans isomerase [uncultured Ruthenibacterium sp.]|uniref:FKBP-type peptidyl-prolyl cis-trans isomerase n=1 Tax=uncultured Ruthenibacterium sp. TaxID=1905347 RepID=UPI00349EF582
MKKLLNFSLVLALCAGMLAGCTGAASSSSSSSSSSASSVASSSSESTSAPEVDFSAGLTADGSFEGITALDYVTLPEDYDHISLPADVTTASDEDIQTKVDSLLAGFATYEQLTDVEVKEGDTVNIDYVGSVDGVEFDGGSTQGNGTNVVAGSTNYIDDFLTQIIGHKPGETFDVNVTFPDPYENNPDLAGKDAVFKTTINYVQGEEIQPELTDDFVNENLNSTYGWTTVEEMRAGIATDLIESQRSNYVAEYIVENSQVSDVPESVITFVKNTISNTYQVMASQYGMDVNDLLSSMGVGSLDELMESNQEDIREEAEQLLIQQAVAEKAAIEVTKEDVMSMAGLTEETYQQVMEVYGEPYMYMTTRTNLAGEYLLDNTVEA